MKIAYLEIGNKCFCKCVMCDAHKNKNSELTLDVIYERLKILKLNEYDVVRLAGNDPMTYPYVSSIIYYINNLGIKTEIVTTLLGGPIDSLIHVDSLKVSLLSAGLNYKLLHGIPGYIKFTANLYYLLKRRSNDIIINYTFLKDINYSQKHANALNELMEEFDTIKLKIHFFPEIAYYQEWKQDQRDKVINFLEHLNFPTRQKFFGFNLKKMSKCTVGDQRIYIDRNGDVFPCCMAGGEIGQNKLEELRLGNVHTSWKTKIDHVDNFICDHCTPKYYNLMKGGDNYGG